MSRRDRAPAHPQPEFVVDHSDPMRIRIWARADIFAACEKALDADERRAGAELAIRRLQTQLRRTRAA